MAEVYKAKWILTSANEESEYKALYEDSALVVENGKITDIIPQSDIYEEVFDIIEDFGNSIITPGFINLNSNLNYKNLPSCENYFIKLKKFFSMLGTPTDNYAMKLANIEADFISLNKKEKLSIFEENLKNEIVSGTTCLANTLKIDKSNKKYFEILNKIPLKTFIFYDLKANTINKSKKVFNDLKKQLKYFIKNKNDSTYFGLHPYSIWAVHKRLWRILGRYFRKNNFILMTELLESKEEFDWINEGFSYIEYYNKYIGNGKIPYEKGTNPVEYLKNLKIFGTNVIIQNGNFLNTKDISILSDSMVNMAFSPTINKTMFNKNLTNETILRNFPKRFGLMNGNSTKTVLEELFSMNLPLPIEEQIKYITFYPAKILGVENIIGSLEYNKHADFNVFKLNKKEKLITDLHNNIKPSATYILGHKIVQDGELITSQKPAH